MVNKHGLGIWRGVRLAGIALLAVALTACNLDVSDPDIVRPEDVADPASLPLAIAGVVGDWQLQHGAFARYTGMFNDDFITSGTFTTRREVDDRAVNPDNATLTGSMYEILHVVRFSSDNLAEQAKSLIGEEGVDQDAVNEAVAIGQFYGGYARIFLAEAYCQSILGGGVPEAVNYESAPISSDDRIQQAVSLLQAAEGSATAAGLSDLADAAKVGQARALMWLGDYAQATAAVATVPPGLQFMSEYSTNDPSQYNDVYDFTYGDNQLIRWTIGDGTQTERFFEAWPYYDEWVDAGLIEPDPPSWANAQNANIIVHLQLIYGGGGQPPNGNGQASPILLASGFEADIYKAEAAYRAGDLAGAEAIINARLTTGANPHGATFDAVDLTGDLAGDIAEIARAYAAGTWLTGYRMGNLRRFVRSDGVDLFPSVTPGNDYSFPIVKQEIDNNPDVNAACQSGSQGSWPA